MLLYLLFHLLHSIFTFLYLLFSIPLQCFVILPFVSWFSFLLFCQIFFWSLSDCVWYSGICELETLRRWEREFYFWMSLTIEPNWTVTFFVSISKVQFTNNIIFNCVLYQLLVCISVFWSARQWNFVLKNHVFIFIHPYF